MATTDVKTSTNAPASVNATKDIYFARLAEQGERFEDMVKYMTAVVKVTLPFTRRNKPNQ